MPFPKAPIAVILERMLSIAQAAALNEQFGLEQEFKFRHERHRRTTRAERPGVAFRLVDISLDPEFPASNGEIGWKAEIDIVVDLELPSENIISGADPTGWGNLSATAGAVANLYLNEQSDLLQIVDDVRPGDADPDEDSKPDDARLAQGLVVLYRTPWNDLNTLLSSEENAL